MRIISIIIGITIIIISALARPSIIHYGGVSDYPPYNQYLFVDITGQADDAFNRKDYKAAESLFQSAYKLATGKNNYKLIGFALLGLGMTSRAQAKYDDAITILNQCLNYKDNIVDSSAISLIYYNLGLSYHYFNKLDSAIENYTLANVYYPKAYWIYTDRADAYQDSQEYDLAITGYNQAIALDSTNAIIYNNQGLAYSRTNEYAQAIENFHKAIELKPTYADAMVNLATAYLAKNDKISAEHWFEQALQNKELLKDYTEAEVQDKLTQIKK